VLRRKRFLPPGIGEQFSPPFFEEALNLLDAGEAVAENFTAA
jgi:hypothetical protein